MRIATALKGFISRIASEPKTPPSGASNSTHSAVVIPIHQNRGTAVDGGSTFDHSANLDSGSLDRKEEHLGRAIELQRPQSSSGPKFEGVLDSPELKSYLSQNFFGFGRHNGVRYQTKQALTTGQGAVISNFINILEQLAEKHRAKRDAMERRQHDVSALSPELGSRLELALRQNDRVIQLLERQVVAARTGEGWISAPLAEYESGFTRGVHDAVDFDHIGA